MLYSNMAKPKEGRMPAPTGMSDISEDPTWLVSVYCRLLDILMKAMVSTEADPTKFDVKASPDHRLTIYQSFVP